jgi:hypothetical protein
MPLAARITAGRGEMCKIVNKTGGGTRLCTLPPPVCTPMRAKAREYADLHGNGRESALNQFAAAQRSRGLTELKVSKSQ